VFNLIQSAWVKLKRWTNPSFLFHIIEMNRISSVPRFRKGQTEILGKKIVFSDSASFIQSYHEIFEQRVYSFKSSNDKPVILDCGANIGLSIIFHKQLHPGAKIIGFEPDPDLFEILRSNLNQFGYTDVELHQKAVMDSNEKVTFLTQGGSSGQVVNNKESENDSTIQVDAVTLHSFITSTIDFLKIDIEGAEYRVLKSIESQLHWVETLFVEYHSFPDYEQELDQILQILRKADFRYYIYPAVNKNLPFQEIENTEGMDMQLNIYAIRE
jgi:FkbM family methyltransferase